MASLFFKQKETVTGLKLTMQLSESAGAGTYYMILVPERFLEEAKQILGELPIDFTDNPDLFYSGAIEREKAGWGVYIWVLLATIAIIFIAIVIYF